MIRESIFLELRDYIAIFFRRWPLVIVPVVLAFILSVASFSLPSNTYTAGIQFLVGQTPSELTTMQESERRWGWITSQYVVTNIFDWAEQTSFMSLLKDELEENYEIEMTLREVDNKVGFFLANNRLTAVMVSEKKEHIKPMAKAIYTVLQRDHSKAIPQLALQPAIISPIDDIENLDIEVIPPDINAWLPIPMRLFVAALAGMGLAMLVEFLDPKVQTTRHLKEMGMFVVGTIPRNSNS